jgi:hypothetical protein
MSSTVAATLLCTHFFWRLIQFRSRQQFAPASFPSTHVLTCFVSLGSTFRCPVSLTCSLHPSSLQRQYQHLNIVEQALGLSTIFNLSWPLELRLTIQNHYFRPNFKTSRFKFQRVKSEVKKL